MERKAIQMTEPAKRPAAICKFAAAHGCTEEYPWYADTCVLSPEKFGDWAALMPKVSAKLAAFAR